MDLQRIRYFLAAAECNNFSQAAQKFFITPQAMAKQISLLEEELGVSLFDRKGRSIRLSETGSFAVEKFRLLDQHFEQTQKEIKEYSYGLRHVIRIAFFSGLSKEMMVHPIVNLIISEFPEYRLELSIVDIPETSTLLANGSIDLCFTNVHQEEKLSDYEKLVFCESQAEVAVSLYHPWAILDTIYMADLQKESFIKMEMKDRIYTIPKEKSFYETIPCRQIIQVPNFETLRMRLEQGEGFAVIPRAFTGASTSRLKFFPFPGRQLIFETAAVYRRDHITPELQKILNLIREEFVMTEVF